MENVKNILSIDPFKTYLVGYYAVNGGSITDQETGEVKDINLNRYELQIISPTDPENGALLVSLVRLFPISISRSIRLLLISAPLPRSSALKSSLFLSSVSPSIYIQ